MEQERTSLVGQLVLCHGLNKRVERPWQMFWTSFGGDVADKVKKNNGWMHWPITMSEKPYEELISKEDLVYLTADAEVEIEVLDSSKVIKFLWTGVCTLIRQ